MSKKLGFIFVAVAMCMAFGYGQAAAQIEIVPGGIGDELNGIYDVRIDGTPRTATGWQNFFVIENTTGNWTAVHLRLRAHKCSIEVWDHVILLSPYDVFWFALDNQLNDGVPRIFSADADTLLNSGLILTPLLPGEIWEDWLSDDLMEQIGPPNDMTYGHVEVIGMFQLGFPTERWQNNQDTHNLYEVVHDLFPFFAGDGYINVFDVMQAAYYQFDNSLDPVPGAGWLTRNPAHLEINYWETPNPIPQTHRRRVLDCSNALAGNYIWGDLVSAEMGMENMIAVQDFRTQDGPYIPFTLSRVHRDGHYSGAIVFPPQNLNMGPFPLWPVGGLMPDLWYNSPAWYLNPDWATQVGPTLRDGDALVAGFPVVCDDDEEGRFNDIWSHVDVDWAYSKFEVWYNYFQDSPFGGLENYDTDVYFVFKTKYLNDIRCDWLYWNSDGWNPTVGGVADYLAAVAAERWSRYSCENQEVCFTVTAWDMDENTLVQDPPVPSPDEFRYPTCIEEETNIKRFSTDPGLLTDPTVFYSPFTMGHFRADDFRSYTFRYAGAAPTPLVPGLYGLVYFRHTFGVDDFIRSAMAEWHYRPLFLEDVIDD